MNTAAVALLAVSLGFIGGCSVNQAAQQPVEAKAPEGDFAAIAFFDCGQMIAVEFISFDGRFQQVAIQGPAQLIDTQLRMSHVDYNRVQYVQNTRPCGFVVDEKDGDL